MRLSRTARELVRSGRDLLAADLRSIEAGAMRSLRPSEIEALRLRLRSAESVLLADEGLQH